MKRLLYLLSGLCLAVNLQAQEVSMEDDLPQATKMLPAPPTNTSMRYVNDYLQYKYGKSARQETAGTLAYPFIIWDFTSFLKSLSKALNITLSETGTPDIFKFLEYGNKYAGLMLDAAHESINRQRPYVYYGETTFVRSMESEFKNVSSYPCDQAVQGWLLSLMLTEVIYEYQDQILARGYKYGPAMIIAGYNWESDVHAGHQMASALLSRMHAHDEYNTLMSSARSEYMKLKGNGTRADAYLSSGEMPDSYKILPTPPDSTDCQFYCDLTMYQDGLLLRTKPEGEQAIQDITYDIDNFCTIFSEVLCVTISSTATPALYELLKHVYPLGNDVTQRAKAEYARLRPYVYLNQPTSYPNDEEELRSTGSYPSGHASGSWLMALVLSEATRSHQDELFARAYQFGQGRVITGYHWQSDVDAGRLMASAVYARLHAESDFTNQMKKAIEEFKAVKGGDPSGIRMQTVETTTEATAPIYTLDGVRLSSPPSRSGIYIRDNRKVAY